MIVLMGLVAGIWERRTLQSMGYLVRDGTLTNHTLITIDHRTSFPKYRVQKTTVEMLEVKSLDHGVTLQIRLSDGSIVIFQNVVS